MELTLAIVVSYAFNVKGSPAHTLLCGLLLSLLGVLKVRILVLYLSVGVHCSSLSYLGKVQNIGDPVLTPPLERERQRQREVFKKN